MFALAAVPSLAQNGERAADSGQATDTAGVPAVEAIPVDRIGVMAERSQRTVSDLDRKLVARDVFTQIEAALPGWMAAVDELLVRSVSIRESEPDLAEIDDLREEWRVLGRDIGAAQSRLGQRALEISRMHSAIARDIAVWTATRAAAGDAVAGREVTDLIDRTLSDLAQVRETARTRQGGIVALQGQVARLTETQAIETQALDDLRRGRIGQILRRGRPAIWSAEFYDRLSTADLLTGLSEHRDRDLVAIRRFVDEHRERLIFQLVLSLLLVPVMFSVRARVRRIEDGDAAVAHMQTVFERPIALALLLSFLVVFWGYGALPLFAAPLVGAAFLLPAVLILRRLLGPEFRPLLFLLLVLFFVDRLIDALSPLPVLPRLIFVGEMFAVFVYSRWWQRASGASDLPIELRSSISFRWVGHATRFALVATPVAILAELAGYTALAQMLGGVLLTGGYAAIVLYGAAHAIDGLVAWLLIVRPLRLSGMVQRQRALIRSHVAVHTRWLLGALFVYVVLRRLRLADAAWSALQAVWTFEIPLISIGLEFGSILEFLIVVRFTFAVSKFVQFVLDEEVYTRVRMIKGQPYAISRLTHYAVLLIGFLAAVFALGVDLNRFTVLAGALGVGIGFGLQTVVNNFVSGIILLTEQPVQLGDTIEIEGVVGEVQRIGIRSSTVRTWQGAEVIVPNAQLVAERVTNWTLSDANRRLEIPVGVAYGTDPERVQLLLVGVAKQNAAVIAEPPPAAFFMRFGDSALEFELRCWTNEGVGFMRVRSDLIVGIERALREAGIVIPFPQRDLHLRSLAPEPEAADPQPTATGLAAAGAGQDR